MTATRTIATLLLLIALAAPAASDPPAPPYGWDLASDVDWLGLQVDRVHVGAWLDASFRDSDLDGEGSNLAVNHLNGFVDVRLEERWQFFAESEFEYQPAVGGLERESEVELEQAYVNYAPSDALEIRVGRFSTPFGYWTPVHWSISTDTVVAPLHEERRFVPEQQIGARLHGAYFLRPRGPLDLQLDYSLFGGYSSDDMDNEPAAGSSLGGDLRVSDAELGFLGVSLLTQEAEVVSGSPRRRETSSVLYAELTLPWHFLLRGEYVTQRRSGHDGVPRYRHAGYAKLRWEYQDFYANYRLERADDEEFGRDAVHWVHRWTLGYSPRPRVRLRAEFAHHELQHGAAPDFDSWALWLGVFF